ncbi:ankyrin repeat-containing domain protein [Russula vinacea]|nr:ankyrin repeat-containing domain protein [Russula vinacea]
MWFDGDSVGGRVAREAFRGAELLHRNGADVDVRDTSQDTPLREACKAGALDIMQWLLNHGADVNAQGLWLLTPLHSYRGTSEGIRLLLKHGANMDAEDDQGRTPLQLALERGEPNDVATCLKEHGATR